MTAMRYVLASQPQTMVGFLKSIGGVRYCTEMRVRDAKFRWPKLVNDKRGKSLDYAREACEEAGFLPSFSSVSDFLDALDAHPHYRPIDLGRLAAWEDQSAASQCEAYPTEDDEFDALVAETKARHVERTALEKPMADNADQARRALAWRKAQKLSRAQLAQKTGFSMSQIQDYEQGSRRGKSGHAAEISADAWKRYKLACAAVEADLPDTW